MARLKRPPERLRPLVAPISFRDPELPVAPPARGREPWRALYNTARWQRLRMRVFVRDRFSCHRCGRIEGDTSKLVAHHLDRHRGDPLKFWDEKRITTTCERCHSTVIQAEERRAELSGE